MSAPILHLDAETRSPVDLKAHNAYVYFDHPETDLWCAAYAFGGEDPKLWRPGEPCPAEIMGHVLSGGLVAAWNAAFERLAWNKILGPRYGWPVPSLEQFRCVMVMAYAMALPGKLEKAAPALGLDERKDAAGKLIMLQMSRPRRPRKGESATGTLWVDDPEKRARLEEYCRQDVRTEIAVYNRLLHLRPSEQRLWFLDQRLNDKGVYIDEPLCNAALAVVEKATARLDDRMRKVTDYAVRGVSNVGELSAYLRANGVETDSLAKDVLVNLLVRSDLPPAVREALIIRQEGAKVSTAKIPKMLGNRQADGRMRGNLQFHGAATGRWAARGAQLQNLPRPSIHITEEVIADVMSGDTDLIEMIHGPAMTVVSDCIRGMIRAAPGHRLLALDYSQIEARVIAWLAGQHDVLEAFRKADRKEGPDNYLVEASKIYGVPITDKEDPRRQVGKVASLSLGFEGGAMALLKMARNYGLDLAEAYDPVSRAVDDVMIEKARDAWEARGKKTGVERRAWLTADMVKQLWRAANPMTVKLWKDVNQAALDAVSRPGHVFHVGHLAFRTAGSWLTCRRPSGNVLFYAYPKVDQRKMPWTDPEGGPVYKPTVTFWAENPVTKAWAKQDFYGGFGAQNATQGTARDVLTAGMERAEMAGYAPVISVHDEAVVEAPIGFGSLDEFKGLMLAREAWMTDLPLAASGFEAVRYRK